VQSVIDSNEVCEGQVVPVESLALDFSETLMGMKLKSLNICPDYVLTLCYAVDEPLTAMGQSTGSMSLSHHKVYPFRGSPEDIKAEECFQIEAQCTAAEICHFNMADRKPRLVVGSVNFADGKFVLVAERIFTPKDANSVLEHFRADLAHCRDLLQNKIVVGAKKRTADHLTQETPSKRKCDELYDVARKQ